MTIQNEKERKMGLENKRNGESKRSKIGNDSYDDLV